MYFRHKFYLFNNKRTKKYEFFSLDEKYQVILKLYDDFIKRYLKPLNKTNDINAQKVANKFLSKFQWFLKVIQEIEINQISINDYFKSKR